MDITAHHYNTIRLQEQRGAVFLQIYRPEANNSINALLVEEILLVLKQLEADPAIKVVVLEGYAGHFCTGMDFRAVSESGADIMFGDDPNGYYNMLKHFLSCSKTIISKVEGKVNAGGIGLVAASDIVIADEKATFGLSEALFGLLPACVMPFLVRRVGFQKAQWMTLLTQPISAQRAYEIGLVDEISDNVNDTVRRNLLRLARLETSTIKELKEYMMQLWYMDEQTQKLAVDKLTSLVNSESVQTNIKNFIQNGKFPWDK
ncbi:MAG: enoyl-CoA hydratase/isomerase [Phaeodactylibacter sp.]|nr:enoyl-CoA hydratase/isomerase [Phaeodactylibacter sp.]MCB9298323.1 enoyl-CoA hydratase/isomerase [Lewinellaceae bacterium]